ncbi:hypothetical protein, partial [Escherichia coli]|uniref:hypothetical protein n=1 Tax=Escherichia coli TaxID=562 RepID=UPI001BAE5C56
SGKALTELFTKQNRDSHPIGKSAKKVGEIEMSGQQFQTFTHRNIKLIFIARIKHKPDGLTLLRRAMFHNPFRHFGKRKNRLRALTDGRHSRLKLFAGSIVLSSAFFRRSCARSCYGALIE